MFVISGMVSLAKKQTAILYKNRVHLYKNMISSVNFNRIGVISGLNKTGCNPFGLQPENFNWIKTRPVWLKLG